MNRIELAYLDIQAMNREKMVVILPVGSIEVHGFHPTRTCLRTNGSTFPKLLEEICDKVSGTASSAS